MQRRTELLCVACHVCEESVVEIIRRDNGSCVSTAIWWRKCCEQRETCTSGPGEKQQPVAAVKDGAPAAEK